MKVLGLALSNGLVALAGGLMTQFQGYADINMGRGAIVIGLAAVIIGEVLCDALFRKGCNFAVRLGFVVGGGIAYYIVICWNWRTSGGFSPCTSGETFRLRPACCPGTRSWLRRLSRWNTGASAGFWRIDGPPAE